MLQGGSDVNFLGSFHHAVQDHVDEDVGAGPAHPVTAMNDHRAGPTSVALVHFPSELQYCLGGGGDV